jgi:protein O-GlcNAc transferase
VNLGMIQSDKKAYDDAALSLERATKLKPDFALAWNRLGRVELRRGHVDRAVEAHDRARKIDPKNGGFAADLCRSLIEQKSTARAVSECRAAVALDAKNPLAHYELGKALVAKGDCAEARKVLARFRALPEIKPEAKTQADKIAESCGRAAGKER